MAKYNILKGVFSRREKDLKDSQRPFKIYRPGDTVEMTDAEAEKFGRFRLVAALSGKDGNKDAKFKLPKGWRDFSDTKMKNLAKKLDPNLDKDISAEDAKKLLSEYEADSE